MLFVLPGSTRESSFAGEMEWRVCTGRRTLASPRCRMGECKFVSSPKFGKVSLNLFLIRAVRTSAKFTSPGEYDAAALRGRQPNHGVGTIQQWDSSCGKHATKSRRKVLKWARHLLNETACFLALASSRANGATFGLP
jgi:hypothetical protein